MDIRPCRESQSPKFPNLAKANLSLDVREPSWNLKNQPDELASVADHGSVSVIVGNRGSPK